MGDNLFKSYMVECVSGAVAAVALGAALVTDVGAAFASEPLGAVATAVCALSSGILCGSLLRRLADGDPLAAARARIVELEVRPTVEAYTSACDARDRTATELAEAQAALTAVSEELTAATHERDELAHEVERARQTASLDRFSDFQLLAMTDICDAEDAKGYLLRPYGDPAMEQLQALGAVVFDTAQTQSESAGKDLRWTLKAEWRQAVRAQREAVDERTRALRDRRAVQAAAVAGE